MKKREGQKKKSRAQGFGEAKNRSTLIKKSKRELEVKTYTTKTESGMRGR